jgi:hypothetical protein
MADQQVNVYAFKVKQEHTPSNRLQRQKGSEVGTKNKTLQILSGLSSSASWDGYAVRNMTTERLPVSSFSVAGDLAGFRVDVSM